MALVFSELVGGGIQISRKVEIVSENGEMIESPIFEITTKTKERFYFRETGEGAEFGSTIRSMRKMNADQMLQVLQWAMVGPFNDSGVVLH